MLFEDLVFYVNQDAEFDAHSVLKRDDLEEKLSNYGGIVVEKCSSKVTHVVDFNTKAKGYYLAKSHKVKNVVSPEWVTKSIEAGKVQPVSKFKPSSGPMQPLSVSAPSSSSNASSKKREREDEDEEEEVVKKVAAVDDSKIVVKQVVKGRAAVDQYADAHLISGCHVLDQGGDNVWDALLTLTNIDANNNKFFVLQVLEEDKNAPKYHLFTRWGRVGAQGQKKVQTFSSVQEAQNNFKKKFKEKSGNNWEDAKSFVPKSNKYVLIHKDYGVEEDNNNNASSNNNNNNNDGGSAPKQAKLENVPESTLPSKVKAFVALIWDEKKMQEMLASFEFDLKKNPLGKMKKVTLMQGLAKLKEIEENLDAPKSVLSKLSSEYYSLIPHNFGMKVPPVIRTSADLQREVDLVTALGEIEIAKNLVEVPDSIAVNPLDAQYAKLKSEIWEEKDAHTLDIIKRGITSTHGHTYPHDQYKLSVVTVYGVKRHGEDEAFKPFANVPNRQLLYHGSRLSNFVGIISQGLRIAPPEAPNTGCMFGKGVYFANCASKSANYCHCTPESPDGLLILAEVALEGMHDMLKADNYMTEKSLPPGKVSTFGRGKNSPSDKAVLADGVIVPLGPLAETGLKCALMYDEFVVYTTARVRMRYIVHVKFDFK